MTGPPFPVPVPASYRSERVDHHVLVALSEEWDAVVASGILEGFPRGAEVVSMRGRGTMFRISLASGTALVRPARHGGLLRSLTGDRFRDPFRPARELALTASLIREGVSAPEPIAAAAVKNGSFFRLYYVSREVAGEDLYALLSRDALLSRGALPSGDPPAAERVRALRRAGAIIRGLHERGVVHSDLHPKNLFVAEGTGEVLVLDLDRTHRGPMPSAGARLENLVRFYRFGKRRERVGDGGGWSDADLHALLEGYTGGDPGELEGEVLRSYSRSSWLHRIGWRLERAFAGH
jgi:hypothetical protein